MRKSKFTESQIVAILVESESGLPPKDLNLLLNKRMTQNITRETALSRDLIEEKKLT
jgi:sialic acid synthase SpsE